MPLAGVDTGVSRRCWLLIRTLFVLAAVVLILNLVTDSLVTLWARTHTESDRVLADAPHSSASVIITDGFTQTTTDTATESVTEYTEPFYVHYVKFGQPGKPLKFMDYVSVLSAINNVKPERIFVHGDYVPTGPYWKLLTDTGLVEHKLLQPTKVLGVHRDHHDKHGTEIGFTEHWADIAKLDAVIQYGGVSVDFDVFFVRGERIKKILQTKESITCYGDEDGYNIGFVVGRKGAELVTAWRRSYEDIYQKDWNFNQARVSKYLSVLYRQKNYVVGFVCNNPHPHQTKGFFKMKGVMNWTNSLAIHSYYRHTGIWAEKPEDLYSGNYTNTTNMEMMRTLYEGKPLAAYNEEFQDEMDPVTGLLVGTGTTLQVVDSVTTPTISPASAQNSIAADQPFTSLLLPDQG